MKHCFSSASATGIWLHPNNYTLFRNILTIFQSMQPRILVLCFPGDCNFSDKLFFLKERPSISQLVRQLGARASSGRPQHCIIINYKTKRHIFIDIFVQLRRGFTYYKPYIDYRKKKKEKKKRGVNVFQRKSFKKCDVWKIDAREIRQNSHFEEITIQVAQVQNTIIFLRNSTFRIIID